MNETEWIIRELVAELPIGVTVEADYQVGCGGMQTLVLRASSPATIADAQDRLRRARAKIREAVTP